MQLAHLEARRLRAIALVSGGTSQAEAARQLGVTREAVRQWVEAWRLGGPAALASRPRRKPGRVPLPSVAETVARARRGSASPLTTRRVLALIERAHGVAYSLSSIRAILRRLGYTHSRDHGWRASPDGWSRPDAKRRAG